MNIHNHHAHQATDGITSQIILTLPFVLAIIIYIVAVTRSSRHYKQWPWYRTVFWISGVLCAAAAVVGPLASRAHMDFTAHMLGHLLLGMIAPLLLVLAAPLTLLFRSLRVPLARRFSRLLKSSFVRVLSDPLVASILNIGGLWLLYTTDLYVAMQQNILLHVFIHLHVFFAGYLFTISMITIDPTPHRSSFVYRAVILVVALAGHGILSKFIYANPPSGVATSQAEMGGMIMYYGGDIIDIVLIFILCLQWFKATRPRKSLAQFTM